MSDATNRFKELRVQRLDSGFDYCHDSDAKFLADEFTRFAYEFGLKHLKGKGIVGLIQFIPAVLESYYWLKLVVCNI